MTATCSPVEKDEPPEGDAKQKQWSTTARRGEHISNRRRKGANEDTEDDVLDLISPCALEAYHTARVTLAGRAGGDVLHFVLTEMQRNRDRNG